jgi:hypothetical protein
MTDDGRLDVSKLQLFKEVEPQAPDVDAPNKLKLEVEDDEPETPAKPAPLGPLPFRAPLADSVAYLEKHADSFPSLRELYGSPEQILTETAEVLRGKLALSDATAKAAAWAIVDGKVTAREVLSAFEIYAAKKIAARAKAKAAAAPASKESKAPAPKAPAAKPSAPHVTRTFPKDYDRWDDKRQNAWLAAWSEKYAQRKA